MPNFEFVVSNGPPRKRPSAAIRSHAVKNGLLRKGQEEAPDGSRDSQLTLRQKDSLKGRFRLDGGTKKTKKPVDVGNILGSRLKRVEPVNKAVVQSTRSTALVQNDFQLDAVQINYIVQNPWSRVGEIPGQVQGDPFGTFPVPLTESVAKLINFFISRFDLPVSIAAVQKCWWEYAHTNPLLMHTTLSLAAASMHSLLPDPKGILAEGYRQKGLALRGIQERINQGDKSLVVVGAIASLAHVEGVEGNFHAARLHLKGLDLLVKACARGYDEVKSNINVSRAVSWSDIQAANGLGLKPLFPIIIPLDSLTLPAGVMTVAEQPSLSHLKVFEKSRDDTHVRLSFSLVRRAQSALRHKDVSGDDFRVLVNAVDHYIASTLGSDSLSSLGRMLITAAHIVYYATVREASLQAIILKALTQRLHKLLDIWSPILSSHSEYQQGLLWCMVVGSAATYERGEGWNFFSANLSTAITRGHIFNLLQLEMMTKKFIWNKSFPGEFLKQYESELFPASHQ